MCTTSAKLEAHFYELITALPKDVVNDAVPLTQKDIDRVVSYAYTQEGRRPVNKKRVLNLRSKLLDYLDTSRDKYLDLLVEKPP